MVEFIPELGTLVPGTSPPFVTILERVLSTDVTSEISQVI